MNKFATQTTDKSVAISQLKLNRDVQENISKDTCSMIRSRSFYVEKRKNM